MSKEMMIVFVYDTQLINRESDDLNSAILYFYPAWVSEQQKSALCGQIMGATQFFKSVFNCPEIIALQSGKFAIREYGRYVLAVGTDRNVADWVLEYRAKTLSMLITFFHQDLEALNKVYQTSESISVKLCYMFETYLKILTYSYNLFSNIPKIALPKSASNVFLEAMQILQCCQEIDQVLGGTMLYHNRVVATQLSSNLTKRIVLTDPYRIKSPGEIVQVDYQLPLGVQLLEVYIEGCDYQDLLENATRTKTVHQYLNKKNYNKSIQSTKEPVITFMKRDQSIIFTAVPEEDVDSHSPVNIENNIIPARPLMRPKFLNLHNKTTESEKPIPKPPTTPFYGQTSVCSTPMTDLNKVLYQNVMSICKDPEEANVEEVSDEKAESSSPHEPTKVTKKGTPAKTKSIADPTCPFLKADGSEMSASFREGQTDGKECEWKSVENSSIKNESFDINAINAKSGRENRKGLSLPLKSLSTDSEVFSPVGRNKNCGGVQLTPLMSKLSLLAMEERSSGFCSRGTTPSEYKDFKFTPTQPNYSFLNSSKKSESKFRKPINVQLKKSTLFICGHQDMVVALILEENAGKSKDIIQKLWSICIESLGKLEKQLRQCLETYHGGGSNSSSSQSISSEPYSYLSLDQYWETIQKSGPWDVQELGAVTHLHRDFTSSKNITEILLRYVFMIVISDISANRCQTKQISSVLSTMGFHPCCKKVDIKCANYILGAFFMGITAIEVNWAIIVLSHSDSRVIHMVVGFNFMFMVPFIIFLVGIYFLNRLLLLPMLACVIISVLFHAGCIIIVLLLRNYDDEIRKMVFDLLNYNPFMMVGLWAAKICLDFYFILVIIKIILLITEKIVKVLDIHQGETRVYAYKRWGLWGLLSLTYLLIVLYNLFCFTCRDDDCIIYGHQCGQNEIFYRQTATSNAGLPTPADPMGMVPLKARRRLERDQAVVLL